ncbi:MAG: flap endonuclease-1 [Candidatus Aenigmarchaeota archaeon]|nr:flap endonuclease-1 [Candidatus Aenigmarchaeota archaeon]
MGVNISELIEGAKKTIEISDLTGRKIAIDAMNVLYQFISIIRQPDGTPLKDSKGRITSHLSGIFYRTAKLLEYGIKPCYVFDGEPPKFKETTNAERRSRREEARRKYEEALERGDIEEARKWAQQGVRVDEDIIKDSKELLEAMGIPFVQAPSEGEAQAAFMVRNGDVWASASQDFDSLLFGASILLRNITITGRRKLSGKEKYIEIKPELISLKDVLEKLKITHDQLIILGMYIGTDFNPGGIEGIGPKRALEMVKKDENASVLLENLKKNWTFNDVSPEEIFNFFKNPPLNKDYSLVWNQPNEEKIKRILCDEHDFSEDRIQNTIEKIKKSKGLQSRLDKWIK